MPGAQEAVGRLCLAGYVPIVVSNQRGVARGLVSMETLASIEDVIQRGLSQHRARIAGFYYCPHDLDAACDCRKPAPGLLLQAATDHQLDLSVSTIVGDSETDIHAGQAAGCRTIRIAPTGERSDADVVVSDLPAAVVRILA